MNKINIFKDAFSEKNDSKEESQKDYESDIKIEKVLCHHCGRTSSNGIRCLGICVADNEY